MRIIEARDPVEFVLQSRKPDNPARHQKMRNELIAVRATNGFECSSTYLYSIYNYLSVMRNRMVCYCGLIVNPVAGTVKN